MSRHSCLLLSDSSGRSFFLHDGRANDLVQAILEHDSNGSEASMTIDRFRALSNSDKQDLINFLRSL